MSEPSYMRLQVTDFVDETPWIRAIALASPSRDALRPAEPGSHLRIRLPGDYDDRHYSLVDLPGRSDEKHYVVGVRLEMRSKGGSRYMHALTTGDKVWAFGPNSSFPLVAERVPIVMFAGGIGITPLTSMATRLAREGREFALHYAGRSRGQLAFLKPLREVCGDRLRVYCGDEPSHRLDIAAALDGLDPDAHVYVCGPAKMIEAARTLGAERGVADERIHFELFEAPKSERPSTAFEVVLASSGSRVEVAADKTILAALREAGYDPAADCERGGCGVCQARVIEGVPDHRDAHLSQKDRERGDVMQICVSRALTPSLVLDL